MTTSILNSEPGRATNSVVCWGKLQDGGKWEAAFFLDQAVELEYISMNKEEVENGEWSQ